MPCTPVRAFGGAPRVPGSTCILRRSPDLLLVYMSTLPASADNNPFTCEPWPCSQAAQTLLSTPWFGALKASFPRVFCGGVSFSQTPVSRRGVPFPSLTICRSIPHRDPGLPLEGSGVCVTGVRWGPKRDTVTQRSCADESDDFSVVNQTCIIRSRNKIMLCRKTKEIPEHSFDG